jgi:hypothetical protein
MAGHHSTKIVRKFPESFMFDGLESHTILPCTLPAMRCFSQSLRKEVGMRMSRLLIGTVLWVFMMPLGLGPAAFAESGMHDTDDTEHLRDT